MFCYRKITFYSFAEMARFNHLTSTTASCWQDIEIRKNYCIQKEFRQKIWPITSNSPNWEYANLLIFCRLHLFLTFYGHLWIPKKTVSKNIKSKLICIYWTFSLLFMFLLTVFFQSDHWLGNQKVGEFRNGHKKLGKGVIYRKSKDWHIPT